MSLPGWFSLYRRPRPYRNRRVESRPTHVEALENRIMLVADFGDAPDTYHTLLSSDGPYHPLAGEFYLGTLIDAEADGQPGPGALNDDEDVVDDDEDGVVVVTPLVLGSVTTIDITASVAGKLDAWIDWDQDGEFEPTEQIAEDATLASGSNAIAVDVPTNALSGETYSRFRFGSEGGLAPTGAATDGEVEDYQFRVFQALLGPIDDISLTQVVAGANSQIYRLQATHDGVLTAGLLSESSDLALSILTAEGDSVQSASSTDPIRTDATVQADTSYIIRVANLDSESTGYSLRLTNLVGIAGSELSVAGTATGDTMTVGDSLGDPLSLDVNGVVYQRSLFEQLAGGSVGALSQILIQTGDGGDVVAVNAAISVPARIDSGSGDDWVSAGSGPDFINVGHGDDIAFGGDGDDNINGGSGSDNLTGGNGDDRIKGHGGQLDVLSGGLGDDIINGGGGWNQLVESGDVDFTLTDSDLNGVGYDLLIGIREAVLTGGPEANWINAAGATTIRVVANGKGGNDRIDGGAKADRILGGSGDDELSGGAGDDALLGHSGADAIHGDDGNDKINGGSGNDLLFGDGGNDRFQEGAGNDNLVGGNWIRRDPRQVRRKSGADQYAVDRCGNRWVGRY